MSKLIYAPSAQVLEATYSGSGQGITISDQTNNPVYFSVAFTGDGYMYTHGKKFRLFQIINDSLTGPSFDITNGQASFSIDGAVLGGVHTVVQYVVESTDQIVTATTSNGTVTLGHKEYLELNSTTQYGSATQVPIITVDKYGHITAVQNSTTIDVSKVSATATNSTGTYYPIAVTDSNLQNPQYNSNIYFDNSGNLHVTNLYIGSTNTLADLYAPKSHLTVYATGSDYGHVILSDTVDSTKDVSEHIAATPKAVSAGVAAANQYAQDLFAAQDAMVFVGTIDKDGIITSHNNVILPTAVDDTTSITYTNYKVGWTFRFIEAGTFNGEDVEVGDMIIAVHAKGNEFDINDWTIIQTNISGALTATSNLNGLLYASNSRVVQALSLSTSGILKNDNGTLLFVNPNTTWRDIQVNATSIGTYALNLKNGNAISITDNNGEVTIAVNAATILSAAQSLTISQDLVSFTYSPATASTLVIGDKLALVQENNSTVLRHATAANTFSQAFGKITTDSYGHITAVEAVTSLPNTYSLTVGNTGNTITYDGSEARSITFGTGTDCSLSTSVSEGVLTVTPSITHKYRQISYKSAANATDASSSTATSLLANSVSTAFTLVQGNNIQLETTSTGGELKITAIDTWRPINAYHLSNGTFASASIGTGILSFSNDFKATVSGSTVELGLVWTEIDENGNVTYVN